VKRVITSEFLPIPSLDYDLIGRKQSTTPNRALRLTAIFFIRREK